MFLKPRMISILVQVLVFKLHFALATDTEAAESNTEASEKHENRIVRPSGFAFQHISNHRPEIVYFSEQTTLRVNTAKRWKTTQPTTTTSTTTTTTPRPFVSSKLRKIVNSYGSSGESDNSFFSASSKDESSESKSNESGKSRSNSAERYSESVESNESYPNKSTKRKTPKKAPKEAASTSSSTTTAKPHVTFPPNKHPTKKHQNPQAIFNQLPGPPVLRAPVRTQIDGYQIYEPYAEDHLVRPPPPHYRHGRPYGFVPQPSASYYRPRQNAPLIFNNPLAGFFRFPVYRKFVVASKPKEPPPQPPPPHHHHHHPPPPKKPEHPKKDEAPKKHEPPKKEHKSKEHKSKEEKEEEKGSVEEEGEEKEHHSHSEEEEHSSKQHTSKEHHSSESGGHSGSDEGSDEKKYNKSTSYKIHESTEKKDKKKYDDKGGSETSGSKKGHKSSEKKDAGAHDSEEMGFVKEEGIKFNHENRKRKGFNTDKGYVNKEHFGKGHKGEYDEKKNSDFAKAQNDKKESKHGDAKAYGQTDHKYRDDKGGKFNEQKLHNIGAKTLGYHNLFHKDEYKKIHTYYDDADEQGKHNKFDDEHEEYGKKEGSSEEGGEDNSVHNGGVHWKYGHLRKGDDSNETEEWSSKNSKSKGYSESNEYENEDGHKKKKHKGYSWK